MGGSADAVPPNIRFCLRSTAALVSRNHAARVSGAADFGGVYWRDRISFASAAYELCVPLRLLFRRQHGLSRRTGETAAADRAADRILFFLGIGRRSGRRIQCSDRAVDI